jgi:ribosomal protein L11 methyltransferase
LRAKQQFTMSTPPAGVTFVARLATDAASAAAIQDALAEVCDGEAVAISIAQTSEDQPDGRWSLALHFRTRPDETAVRALIVAVAEQVASRELARALARDLTFEVLAATDWVRKSLEGLTPVEAGRFVVPGAHDRGRFPANRITIQIDAGLAFGTGHHGSTRGCLLALDRIVKRTRRTPVGWAKARVRRSVPVGKACPRLLRPGIARAPSPPLTSMADDFAHPRSKRRKQAAVLDLGTGTGVLAIAAAKALQRPVLASDIDARAAATARNNARINGVAAAIQVVHAAGVASRCFVERAPFRLVLANILLEPLQQFATGLARLVAPNGRVVLSGLLNAQARAALASYRARGFTFMQRITLGGWTTLVVTRRGRFESRRYLRNRCRR